MLGRLVKPEGGARLAVAALLIAFFGGSPAIAVALAPGDIIVADRQGLSPARILRVDPASGLAIPIYTAFDGLIVSPRDVEVEAEGTLIVSQSSVPTAPSPEGVYRLDPATGEARVVSEGGLFVDVRGIALDASGDILVADRGDPFGNAPGVIRVNRGTGSQTLVSSGGELASPFDVEVEASGQILVLDGGTGSGAKLIRIDPSSGAQSVLMPVGSLRRGPGGIALEASGVVLVVDAFGLLVRVNPVTGSFTPLIGPEAPTVGIALDNTGALMALTSRSSDRIVRLHLGEGGKTTLPTVLTSPQGLAVVPP